MIHLRWKQLSGIDVAREMLQTAIGVEFGTLPPYLYALFSIRPGTNLEAVARIRSIAMQEMIHMCLACNILNAIGGDPVLTPPVYPGPLPGDIGPPGGKPMTVHLLPFSREAMAQGMEIEMPEHPPQFPIQRWFRSTAPPEAFTIGQFYGALDEFLKKLGDDARIPHRNQIEDSQFFAGQLFEINSYADAHRAIGIIVSEGEGAGNDPLDFQNELAHYYRFQECLLDRVLNKEPAQKLGYIFGPETLHLDYGAVYPAIDDPGTHDFSHEPEAAQKAQRACDTAYSQMVDALQLAVTGKAMDAGNTGMLGNAVRAMFDLRTAASVALNTPLNQQPLTVAGPSFLYKPSTTGASS